MNPSQAQDAIESLRSGLPPSGFVRYFTVGRRAEIETLSARLDQDRRGALLLKANYGSGKSHLLRFIREEALSRGYAVSSVTLDARSAVRFNRMDQILGAIWRGLELEDGNGQRGMRFLFDLACEKIEASKRNRDGRLFWNRLTNGWRWDYSEVLESPSMFIALRAWACGLPKVQNLVEDWLTQPWNYYARRQFLYEELVANLHKYFQDPRPDWKFYDSRTSILNFQFSDYKQSWCALRDMVKLSHAVGLQDVIILFDEFEDVLTNLKRVDYQEAAFWNLFRFYAGKEFPGMTFFAVTPDFVRKCKELLSRKGSVEFDYKRFEALPSFEMSPLNQADLETLAAKIVETHGTAFDWVPEHFLRPNRIKNIIKQGMAIQIQDRVRHTIREIVKVLDSALEESDDGSRITKP